MRSQPTVRQAASAQVPMADYIPFGSHVAPDVIQLKGDAIYLACWRLDGVTFETQDAQEIAIRKEGLNQCLRTLADGQWSIWTHKIRRRVRERLDGRYENPFCRELLERYYASFEGHRQMSTELYLTLVYRPTSAGTTFNPLRRVRSLQERREREAEHLTALADAGKGLEAQLKAYGPQRLTTFARAGVVYSELLTLMGFLVNGFWEDVPMRRASISESLPASRLFFGDKNGLLEIWHPNGQKFAGFLDIQEYPQASEPGLCNGILYSDYEYVETQSFSLLNRREGIKALRDQRGHLLSTEDVSQSEIAQMDVAMDQIQSGVIALGEYHYTLTVFGDTAQAVAQHMAEARASLMETGGFKVSVVDAIPECAWFAQLPGNWRLRPREAKLTSRNVAGLAPFHNFGRGKRTGNPWGEALALMLTPSGQPFYLNFHSSPDGADSTDDKLPGNTFICGSTGVGKTTLQMLLLASATKYPDFRAFFLDLDRGAEIGIRAMGGRYVAIERGKPTGFNPFQLEPTAANLQFCERLVRKLIAPEGAPALSARDEESIRAAVTTVMRELPRALRRLAAVDQNLPNTGDNSLRLRLRKWIGNGALGWAFDNPTDTQDFGRHRIFGYDYTEFLDDPEVRTPILLYLLHLSESLTTGAPFIRVMEEFWKALLDETLTDEARKNLKTDRKLGALGVYVTQSPSDVLSSPIGKTIVEQCVTQIYLPNPRADATDYLEGFKVTQAEFELIRSLGETSRQFLVKQGHHSTLVRFDLSAMPDLLSVISGSLDNVRLLDEIRSQTGDDPQAWLPVFRSRVAQRRAQRTRTTA